MSNMFFRCSSLKELNLSFFNTKDIIFTSPLFYLCLSLKEIRFKNFIIKNITNKNSMMLDEYSLKDIIFSSFFSNSKSISFDYPERKEIKSKKQYKYIKKNVCIYTIFFLIIIFIIYKFKNNINFF